MDVNGTLPYFPYRDDGLLLWDKVGQLAKEYVSLCVAEYNSLKLYN